MQNYHRLSVWQTQTQGRWMANHGKFDDYVLEINNSYQASHLVYQYINWYDDNVPDISTDIGQYVNGNDSFPNKVENKIPPQKKKKVENKIVYLQLR